MQKSLTVWCITDGKSGHKNQLLGLLSALKSRGSIAVEWIELPASVTKNSPCPDIIICAGQRTHLTSLKLKWRFGGKLIVLMKPSLPRRLFDLCVIPEHDGVAASERVLVTRGVINAIQPSNSASPTRGLILIGGPSKHHLWSEEKILTQLGELKSLFPNVSWTLTTSRRTPVSFLTKANELTNKQFAVVPQEQTDNQWLTEKYQQCGVIFVSEDSVSMIYEGLTAGAKVGILSLPRKRASRVTQGVDLLLNEGLVTTLSQIREQGEMPASLWCQREADRVASRILQWFDPNPPSVTSPDN